MAIWGALILGAIQNASASKTAGLETEAIREQNAIQTRLASQANQITNQQWAEEQDLRQQELDLYKRRDVVNRFVDTINNYPDALREVINIWSGRRAA